MHIVRILCHVVLLDSDTITSESEEFSEPATDIMHVVLKK